MVKTELQAFAETSPTATHSPQTSLHPFHN